MSLLMLNILLALVWAAVSGHMTPGKFLEGFVLGYVVLWMIRPIFGSSRYLTKVPKVLTLTVVYLVNLVRANIRIAHDVLTPSHHMRPAVIAVPLRAESGLEITMLANLITMTPGSLSLDVSADGKTLYVHLVYCDDPDETRHEISEKLEARLLEVLR